MHQAHDLSLPFENLVDQVKDAVDFHSAGKCPCIAKQTMTASYDLIHEIGNYDTHCKNERALQSIDQNLEKFQGIL